MKITNKYIIKIIKFITPLVFSATLIHSIFFSLKFKTIVSLFDSLRELNIKFIFFKIYILSIIIFIFCLLIDYIRSILFKIMKIREFCLYIERLIPN